MVAQARRRRAPVTWEQVLGAAAGRRHVGRPHIADALVERRRRTRPRRGLHDAAARRPRVLRAATTRSTRCDAVRLVREAGGVAVFAHPAAAKRGRDRRRRRDRGDGRGRAGRHRGRPPGPRRRRPATGCAGWPPTSGCWSPASSDYHGSGKTNRLGENTTDPEVLEALLAQVRGGRARMSAMRRQAGSSRSFVTLFVIMDPPGTMPLFLSLTSGRTRRCARSWPWQAVIVAFVVIAVFALFGQQILDYLGITLPALQVAGRPAAAAGRARAAHRQGRRPGETQNVNVALVPLGTPLLAGPGRDRGDHRVRPGRSTTSATVAGARDRHRRRAPRALAVHALLGASSSGSSRRAASSSITRIAGLLLSAIAVQLIADGVTAMVKAA